MAKVLWLLFLLMASCGDEEKSDITGTLSIASISPSPGSSLPELGEPLTFTFTDVQWSTSGAESEDTFDIVAWFVQRQDGAKVGWNLVTGIGHSGKQTITQEMASWNTTTFTEKPNTLSVSLCKSSDLLGSVVKTCQELAATDTYTYLTE